jgi:hypothetical protein
MSKKTRNLKTDLRARTDRYNAAGKLGFKKVAVLAYTKNRSTGVLWTLGISKTPLGPASCMSRQAGLPLVLTSVIEWHPLSL